MARRTRMIARIRYNYRTRNSNGANIELNVDLSRFNRQYGEAQYALDSMIMTSMVPYMPHETGTFINVTRSLSASIAGSGNVYAAAPPFGRFLYEGKVMVDERTGSPWARPGARKVVTARDINYSRSHNPNVTNHWFDRAKERHGESWVRTVRRIAGGG